MGVRKKGTIIKIDSTTKSELTELKDKILEAINRFDKVNA